MLSTGSPSGLYYNAIVQGTPGSTVSVRLTVPYPFVTVGTEPLQVYDAAALATQAGLEEDGEASLPPELAALQAYLQARAPIDVWVPFARRLSGEIGRRSTEPRLTRDFMKLLSLVKAVTILRQAKRAIDAHGRLVATLDDYGTVYRLAGERYETTTRGATPKVRAVVAAVGQSPREGIGVRALAQKMGPLLRPVLLQSQDQSLKGRYVPRRLCHVITANPFCLKAANYSPSGAARLRVFQELPSSKG